jgi:uncharacterized protein DUF5677
MNEERLKQHLHDLLDHTIYLGKHIFAGLIAKPNEIPKRCCSPLLIKAMHKAHSINVLASEGLLEESEIILRVLVEVSFITGAIEANPDFALKYGRSAYAQKLRTLKNMKNGLAQGIPNLNVPPKFLENLNEHIEYCTKVVKDQNVREIRIIDYAREAGLLSIYYTSYAALCSSVHSGPEDVEPYFSKEERGSILKIAPPVRGNEEIIRFTAIEAMIRILKSLASVFSVESEKLSKAEDLYHGVNALLWERHDPNQHFHVEDS